MAKKMQNYASFLYYVNFLVENPDFVLCKEQGAVIKLFLDNKYIFASFSGSNDPCSNKANLC